MEPTLGAVGAAVGAEAAEVQRHDVFAFACSIRGLRQPNCPRLPLCMALSRESGAGNGCELTIVIEWEGTSFGPAGAGC